MKDRITGFAESTYDELLNLTSSGIMGYLEIPAISVMLPIYHGTDAETLEKGIGHLIGSSLPIGGEGTHSVLTGHSGTAGKRLFSDLENLACGDVFYLHVLDETLAYMVDGIHTVLPEETERLKAVEGEDFCTLDNRATVLLGYLYGASRLAHTRSAYHHH